MRKITLTFAVLAIMAVALPASAYTLNDDGTGFVGKGEVQTVLGLNNNGVQNGTFAFSLNSVTETVTEWTCSRFNPQGTEQFQERSRTATTTITGVVSSKERVRNQVTGFNLLGFSSSSESSVSDGPPLESCPNGWTAGPASTGDPVVVSGGLYVNGVLLP